MAKIDRFGIKQPDGTFQYHDVGAKAENVAIKDSTLNTVIAEIETNIDKKFDSAGGVLLGELTPAGGMTHSGKTGYISFPNGGLFKSINSTSGQLKIYLPVHWHNALIKFKVSIATSKSNSSVDYYISGYMDSVQKEWTQCTATSVGHYNENLSNLKVHFGSNGSVCVVGLGDIETSWASVDITVSDISVNNYTNTNDYTQWADNWNVTINANSDVVFKNIIENPHVAEEVKDIALNSVTNALTNAKSYTDQKIASLIDGAPETLDTLKEISNELSNNKSAIEAINAVAAEKADKTELSEHAASNSHISAEERQKWNAKQDTLVIDSSISETSTNTVQNKAIYNALSEKVDKVAGKQLSSNDFTNDEKSKLANIEAKANNYTHPTSTVTKGTYQKVTVDEFGHVTAGSNEILSVGEGGTGAATVEGALQNFGLTASATELNVLDGISVTTEELNLLSSAESNIQAQLDRKASLDTATQSKDGLLSASDKTKLNSIEEGANKYTHPNHTPHNSGLYKVEIDGLGHVVAAEAATKNDITSLGIPNQDTTYDNATQSKAGLMSAADKMKLDSIDSAANDYVLPQASSTTLGGVKTTSTVNSPEGYTATPIINGVPYYKNTLYTLNSFGVTATADELNYVDGVTSNIQTQLNAKGTAIANITSGATTVGNAESVNGFKIYKDISQLGITSYYIPDIVKAMPTYSMFFCNSNSTTGELYKAGNNLPSSTGNLEILKLTGGRTRVLYATGTTAKKEKVYYCDLDETNWKINGWNKMGEGDFIPVSGLVTSQDGITFKAYDNGSANIRKNYSATADYGMIIKDTDVDGNTMSIVICAKQQTARLRDKGGTYTDILHTGNMKDHVLPLDGSVPMSGDLRLQKVNNGYGVIQKGHSDSGDYGTFLKDVSASGSYSQLVLRSNNNTFKYEVNDGETTTKHDILHSGNVGSYALPKSGGTVTGNISMSGKRIVYAAGTYTSEAGNRFQNSALEIRENDLVGNTETFGLEYAPTIGFHWSNVAAGTMAMDSSGQFNFVKQDGSMANILCGGVIVDASTNYTTNQVRNSVFTTADPGANTSTAHANGSIIYVYE